MVIPVSRPTRAQAPRSQNGSASSMFGEGISLTQGDAVMQEKSQGDAVVHHIPNVFEEDDVIAQAEAIASQAGETEFVLEGMSDDEFSDALARNNHAYEMQKRAEALEAARQAFEEGDTNAVAIAAPLTKKAMKDGKSVGSRVTVLKVSVLVCLLSVGAGYGLTRPEVVELFAPSKVVITQGTNLNVSPESPVLAPDPVTD